jgi:hypothetical protein
MRARLPTGRRPNWSRTTPAVAATLQPGELFGSGTLSGSAPDQAGSLLELTQCGTEPITLPNGEVCTFLADGDTLTLRGYCERPGARRIGFGLCSATVLPAFAGRPPKTLSAETQRRASSRAPRRRGIILPPSPSEREAVIRRLLTQELVCSALSHSTAAYRHANDDSKRTS